MYTYDIDPLNALVLIAAAGHVDLQGGKDILGAVAADPRFREDLGVLVDVRRMTASPSAHDLGQFADFLAQARRFRGRFAIVAAPGVQYGMGRLISTVASLRGVHMNVFLDEAGAREWLRTGIENSTPDE